MIKKLEKRIIIILTAFVALFGGIILVSINLTSYNNLKETCYFQIDRSILFHEEENTNIDTNMITCIRRAGGYMVYSNSTDLDLDKVESLLEEISKTSLRIGNINHYYYYLNLGNEIRIMDFSNLYKSFTHSVVLSVVIYIGFIIGFIYLAGKIASWSVKPVELAFEKQKKFISDVSHELKTPIAIIQANTEILQMDETNKQLDYIAYESNRMNQLITKLLQLTRIESNPAYSKLNEANLSTIVLKAAMPFEALAFEKGFQLKAVVEENIICDCNEMLIEQLVTILLDNALKHTKENGRILLRLSKNHHKIILSVKDEGDEIKKEDLEKIFDRFYRVDESRNRKDNRYGLGLSIAKGIMEVHHGTIEANSQDGVTEFICQLNGR